MKTDRQLLSHRGTITQHETQSKHVEISAHKSYRRPSRLEDRAEADDEEKALIGIASPADADVYSQLHDFLLQG